MGLAGSASAVQDLAASTGGEDVRLTKNLGMLLLALYLILVGIGGLGIVSIGGLGTVIAILAVAAGILILVGR